MCIQICKYGLVIQVWNVHLYRMREQIYGLKNTQMYLLQRNEKQLYINSVNV